jgi:hypothetical protein
VPRDVLIRFRRDVGTPADGALLAGEPAYDTTSGRPRLLIGDPIIPAPIVLADPALVADLQARVRQLEQALRELQFISFTGQPTFIIPP